MEMAPLVVKNEVRTMHGTFAIRAWRMQAHALVIISSSDRKLGYIRVM